MQRSSQQTSKRRPIYLSRDQLENILRNAGVKVVAETEHDLLCYCCFHHNVDSPAFNISKKSPYPWKCWNGSCNQRGNIFTLLTKKGYSMAEARKILIEGEVDPDDLSLLIQEALQEDFEVVNPWADEDPNRFADEDKRYGDVALKYALGRGITEEAFVFFKMGYSYKKNMLIVPAFDESGVFCGVIGRSIEGKQYRYSNGLQRGALVWNCQNVKEDYEEIVLTEGSLDSVYLWQAGIKNCGAILGSSISNVQWKILTKNFSEVTCFFDNDDPGQSLADQVFKDSKGLLASRVYYPSEAKDPGDLSPDQIRKIFHNRKSSIQIILEQALNLDSRT